MREEKFIVDQRSVRDLHKRKMVEDEKTSVQKSHAEIDDGFEDIAERTRDVQEQLAVGNGHGEKENACSSKREGKTRKCVKKIHGKTCRNPGKRI